MHIYEGTGILIPPRWLIGKTKQPRVKTQVPLGKTRGPLGKTPGPLGKAQQGPLAPYAEPGTLDRGLHMASPCMLHDV